LKERSFDIRLFFLAGFILLSAAVATGALRSFDIAATRLVQIFPLSFFDHLSLFFTILGSGELTGAASLVFAWYLVKKRSGGYREAFYFLLLFGLSVAIDLTLKFTVAQPKVFEEFRRGLKIPVPVYSPLTPFAYPSGHATRTTILLGFLYYLAGGFFKSVEKKDGNANSVRFPSCNKYLRPSLVFFYLMMLVSRVYEGSHWTCDIFGGVLLGGYLLASIISLIDRG